MKKKINKYHGTGNDFIIIDNRDRSINPVNTDLFNKLCKRHTGIGADGLMLIYDHPEHNFEMKYYNSDGKEGTMCGNGGRCAVAFAASLGMIRDKGTFLAIDGAHKAVLKDDIITISMGDVEKPAIINGNHFLNTGSPHYIINVPDCSKVDVNSKGREIRWSDLFSPNGTNVNFVETRPDHLFVRTFERGVEAETLSCGTGVTASAISSKWDSPEGSYSVKVKSPGGELRVEFTLSPSGARDVSLSGPARFVFSGEIDPEDL